MLRRVVAKDGVSLALYHFPAATRAQVHHSGSSMSSSIPFSPSNFPPKKIFFSHANGFHGHIFQTTINSLAKDGKGYECWSIDHRGHGQSICQLPKKFNWEIFGEDILTSLDAIADSSEEKIIGVGHSFGATSLLIAALKNPKRFSHLILYEPVVFTPFFRFLSSFSESPLAVAAMKRRRSFASVDAAIENFKSKQPMKSFHPDVLRDYCIYGLTQQQTNNECKENKEWTLCCPPENEAAIFRSGNLHKTMDDLPHITLPVRLIAGRFEWQGLSLFVKNVAKKLPNCQFSEWGDLGHLGPLEDPHRFASAIREFNQSVEGAAIVGLKHP
jgi:pimeloyl-ACP methyl ester carboxylesterase